MPSPVVSALGSCRVFTPLRYLRSMGLIKTDHDGAEWYTHSTSDALQKIDIVRGSLPLDPDIISLLVHDPGPRKLWHPERHSPSFYARSDLFVVEVCSLKRFRADDLYLQQWCLRDIKDDAPEKARDLSKRAQALPQMTEDEIIADMAALREKLKKPILFVSHFNVPRHSGDLFPERERISVALKRGVEGTQDRMFDPSSLVQAHGIKAAIVDAGHYTHEFESGPLPAAFMKEIDQMVGVPVL